MNIRFVLATVPLKEIDNYYKKFLNEMRKVALNMNIPLVDVAKEFDNFNNEERALLFVPDEVHLNKNGTSKVAEIIHDYLIKHREQFSL